MAKKKEVEKGEKKDKEKGEMMPMPMKGKSMAKMMKKKAK